MSNPNYLLFSAGLDVLHQVPCPQWAVFRADLTKSHNGHGRSQILSSWYWRTPQAAKFHQKYQSISTFCQDSGIRASIDYRLEHHCQTTLGGRMVRYIAVVDKN